MPVIGRLLSTRFIRFSLRFSLNINKRSCSTFSSKCNNYLHIPFRQNITKISNQLGQFSSQSSTFTAMSALSPLDPSSFSRPELAIVKHVSLSLNVDFENKILNGVALINFDVLQDIDEVILDISNLTIEAVELEDGTQLNYNIGEVVPNFGSKLTITLPKKALSSEKKGEKDKSKEDIGNICSVLKTVSFHGGHTYNRFEDKSCMTTPQDSGGSSCECCVCDPSQLEYKGKRLKIRIKYKTSPTASALQWLEPNQTSGKKHPYLFSQCQPIHARSILPCQDSPAVKFTYDAQVAAPAPFTVLMSALRGASAGGSSAFRQPVPIPSYLLAIAVGVLEQRSLGPRSTVWSEKEEIERSAWEFAETEKYLQAAERLCGPYVWSRYDLLVLPPSFPYGGMENPCLTFVTPTLLAGDRSQADVIVHEIMHSWTGNLVTNRNFEHFWLNEGFTVFLERKVGASLLADAAEARRSRDFHSLLGLQELTETVRDELGVDNQLTRMVVDLKDVHPDDAFSTVPYEKGSLFLRYIEDLLGGPEVFDDFMRSYLDRFKRQSLDTDQFKAFLLDYFKGNEALKAIDWDAWLYTSGMPPVIPAYDTSMTKAVTALVGSIAGGNHTCTAADVAAFSPHQVINLLQELVDRPPLPLPLLHDLGRQYGVSTSQNAEIVYRWLRLCIRSRDEEKLSEVFDFVNRQGRMKYVRPVYRDLYAWEEVRDRAIDNFLKNEPYMMHVSAYTLRKDLHLSD